MQDLLVQATFALVGLTILAGAIAGAFFLVRSRRNAVYAMATVTQISERREECGSYSIMESVYDSRLEFVAKDGSTVRFTQEHGQSEPAFSKGDQVRIRYEAAHAAKSAQVPSKIEDVALWLTIILSALMGSAFLAAALAKK